MVTIGAHYNRPTCPFPMLRTVIRPSWWLSRGPDTGFEPVSDNMTPDPSPVKAEIQQGSGFRPTLRPEREAADRRRDIGEWPGTHACRRRSRQARRHLALTVTSPQAGGRPGFGPAQPFCCVLIYSRLWDPWKCRPLNGLLRLCIMVGNTRSHTMNLEHRVAMLERGKS